VDDQQRLGDLLLTVPPLHERLQELGRLGLAPGSTALTDLAVPLAELVRSDAVTTITSAVDHLVAWAGLYLRGGLLPTFAHFTLLRSAVETASITRWLVDPTADRRVRVARGIGYTLTDLGERGKLERVPRPAGAPPPLEPPHEFRYAAERIAVLEDAAAMAGLCPLRIGHTDVVARYGLGEFAYRMLCAFAHGGQAVPLAVSSREGPSEADAGGLRTVRLTGDVGRAMQMSDATIGLVHRALGEVFAYHGHAFDPTPTEAR
jgi:hypothetical protein